MDEKTLIIVVASVLSGAWLVLLGVALALCCQVRSLRNKLADLQANSRLRVQKLRMDGDKNHAFHNPALSPDEELSRRGYSMYMGQDTMSDVESGRHDRTDRHQERQTGGQFVEELMHELDSRQHRQNAAPPFLLQSIQDNKKNRPINPLVNGHTRQSDTNPNFIY